MILRLECRSGPRAGDQIQLQPGKAVSVGRSKADHEFSDDLQMSGVHFAIEDREKGWHIRDLKSSNGTFVNRARITEATLANGDEIRAGNTVFIFRILSDEQVSAGGPSSASAAQLAEPSASVSPAAAAGAEASSAALLAAPVSGPSHKLAQSPVPQTPQQRLHALLSREFQPLYALLDAACEPSVLKVIFESKEEFQSLFEGPQGAQLTHFAPYLIRVSPKSQLLDTLIMQAWSKSWASFSLRISH